MKAGDIVKLKGDWQALYPKDRIGILVSYGEFSEDWWDILDCDGRMVIWPTTQLEVIDESR